LFNYIFDILKDTRLSTSGFIFIIGTLILLVIMLVIIKNRNKQVMHITEKLELKHQFQSEVLQTQIEVQEQSFKYFSEEVHDNIAQTLSLVRMKLYKTADKEMDAALKARIEDSNELLAKTMNDLRNLSHVMNGGLVLKLTLEESIEKELSYIKDINDVHCELKVTGDAYDIDPQKKLLTFRIVQEAINNALKHGKPKEIIISLEYQLGMLTLLVADNGCGFNMKDTIEHKGLGLHNMYVRAKLLGEVFIESTIDKGTTITLNVKTT